MKPKTAILASGLGAKALPVEQFALERGEEALAKGVVVLIADRSHRRLHVDFPEAQPERNGRVLRALVRM
jgi:hypothetical protein